MFIRKLKNGTVRRDKPLIVVILGLLVCVVILVSFFPMTWKIKDDAYIKSLEERIESLEKALAERPPEPTKASGVVAEKKTGDLAGPSVKTLENTLTMKINLLSGRVDGIQEQVSDLMKSSRTVESAEKPVKIVREKPVVPQEKPRKQVRPKPVATHVVGEGDTFYSISRQYGISLNRLKELNNFTEETTLHTGDKIIVGP